MRPTEILTSVAVLVALTASGCSTPESNTDTTTVAERPDSIVSLSPSATETLFAVGAGDQVVAVDSQSDYPANAPRTELSAYTPSLEAIVEYEPDLVIASDDIGGLVAALGAADVPVLLLPAATSIDDAYSQIEQVADAVGHPDEGDVLVDEMRSRVDTAVAGVPARDATYFHELDSMLYTVSSDSFIGQVYGLFGLTSIADGAGSDYPQMSDEGVVAADPDFVFLADSQCCGVTVESVSVRPGWATTTAVREGQVFAVDEDMSSRWGPRIADQVESVAAILGQN
ncbi:helical backbone metal receptor [Rhodococcus sovatensis]|uniref:Helical backbone metal receptor n=1 Tax=Rhodococcus sovatensis TaxID=1805840 RepID=A0ABZ2PKY1_9NOCA